MKLIPNARSAWRMLSVQIAAVAVGKVAAPLPPPTTLPPPRTLPPPTTRGPEHVGRT